jgi:hypothetical protein
MENCFKNFHSFWHNVTWTDYAEKTYKLIEATEINDLKFVSLLQTCLIAAMGEMERNNKISYYFHQTNSPEVEGVDRASNLALISRKNWLSNLVTANFCVSVVDDSCEFEKNYVDFLIENIGLDAVHIKSTQTINENQNNLLFDKLVEYKGLKIGVLGLSFKPKTAVINESPGYILYQKLKNNNYDVFGYDPLVETEFFGEDTLEKFIDFCEVIVLAHNDNNIFRDKKINLTNKIIINPWGLKY